LPEKYWRSRLDAIPTRSIESQGPSQITNALHRTHFDGFGHGRSQHGEHVEGFTDVAEHVVMPTPNPTARSV
jgi:hypothetical protein